MRYWKIKEINTKNNFYFRLQPSKNFRRQQNFLGSEIPSDVARSKYKD